MKWKLPLVAASIAALAPAAMAQTQSSPPSSAGVPAGMVAFFSKTTCPQGWAPEPKAQGRLLIAAADPSRVGETLGEPLARRDLSYHAHSYRGEFRYGEQGSAANLKDFHDTVQPGTVVEVSGESQAAWLQVPLMQLPACSPAGKP